MIVEGEGTTLQLATESSPSTVTFGWQSSATAVVAKHAKERIVGAAIAVKFRLMLMVAVWGGKTAHSSSAASKAE